MYSFWLPRKELIIAFSGIIDQIVNLTVVSPVRLQKSELNGSDNFNEVSELKSEEIYKYVLNMKTTRKNNELVFHF